MLGLLSLPGELHLMIATYLSPKEHFRLSTCCYKLWAFHAADIREHAAFASQYGQCQIRGQSIWPLLRAAILNDKVAAAIDGLDTTHLSDFDDEDVLIPDEDVAFFLKSMEHDQNLQIIVVSDVQECIKVGRYGVALAHLLYLSDNLRTFVYVLKGWFTEYMMWFLQNAIEQYQSIPNSSISALPLNNLTHVMINNRFNLEHGEFEWAWLFLQLPSLRDLKCIYMGDGARGRGGEGNSNIPRAGLLRKSNVTSLSFQSCEVPVDWMSILVGNIQALECFRHRCYGNEDINNNFFYVDALEKFARTSLRILMLDYSGLFAPSGSPTLSFQSFEQLVKLYCSISDLLTVLYSDSEGDEPMLDWESEDAILVDDGLDMLEENPPRTNRLVTKFPPTLQSLSLRDVTEESIGFVLELLQEDIHLLPNLRTFCTDYHDDQILRNDCAKHDIEYEKAVFLHMVGPISEIRLKH